MSAAKTNSDSGELFGAEAFEQIPGQMSFDQAADDAPARLTYREKRLRKAERLRGWAEKREAASVAAYERSSAIAERIPFGQPILVGHHSERGHRADIARIDSAMRQSVESSAMASDMLSRADNIEAAAGRAIYSDDPDAIERLTMKIRVLECQRADIKAYNAAARKAAKRGEQFPPELEAASAWIRHEVASLARLGYERHLRPGGALPAYVSENLSGNISRLRDRLTRLERERDHGPSDRVIIAKRSGACESCGAALERGQTIRYNRQAGARCVECKS